VLTQNPSVALEYRIIAAYASSQTSKNSTSPIAELTQNRRTRSTLLRTTHHVPLESVLIERVYTRSNASYLGVRPGLDEFPSSKTASNSGEARTPVHVLIVFPTRPISDLRFHMPKNACKFQCMYHCVYLCTARTLYAAFSKRSSPVSRLKVANSSINEPAPAVPVP
jgi:hypothetical protein